MTDIKEEIETVADNIAHPEQETRKEARRRQPWMPVLGAIIAALLIFLALKFGVFEADIFKLTD